MFQRQSKKMNKTQNKCADIQRNHTIIGRTQVISKKIYKLKGSNGIVHNSSDIANVVNEFFSTVGQFSKNNSAPTDWNAYRNYLQSTNSENHRFKFSTVTFDKLLH